MSHNIKRVKGGFVGLYSKVEANLKTAFKTLFRNATAVILDTGANDRYFFGENDRLPNEIIQAINDSGTATSCVEKIIEFTYAEGFEDAELGKKCLMLNGPSWDEILMDCCTNAGYFPGLAFRIKFTNEGKIFSITTLQIQTLRRENSGFLYNELMGEFGHDSSKDKWMFEYVPGQDVSQRMARIKQQVDDYGFQVGEIYYPFIKRMGRLYNKYPIPYYYSDIESIIADAKVSEFDLRNISQGWRAAIIVATGPVDSTLQDEDGKTEQDYYDDALSQFVGEDASPVLHLKGRTDAEKPTVTVLPLQDVVDAAANASERVPKRVCRVMGVPPILVGFSEAGKLGDTQEVTNIMKLFGMAVIKRQEFISMAFDKMRVDLPEEYTNANFTITSLDVFGTMEVEQEGGTFNADLAGMTGKQAMQFKRIVRDVQAGRQTVASGVSLLMDSFGLTEEKAIKHLTPAV